MIESTLTELNDRFRDDWHAPLVTTRGLDELSGVLRRPRHAFDVMVRVNETIWPNRFRFAMASGTIDVAEHGGDAAAMDGPAFHHAADALRRAADQNIPLALNMVEIAETHGAVAESLAGLYGLIVSRITPARHRVLTAYRKLRSQRAVGHKLGISQQSVSEAMGKVHAREFFAAEAALGAWLADLETHGEKR